MVFDRKTTRRTALVCLAVIILIVVSSCTYFSPRTARCTDGVNCRFYTGTQGVNMYPQSLPRTLYYRSADVTPEQGNTAEFNIMLHNRGASDSFGAIFLSGFGPEVFDVYRLGPDGRDLVHVGSNARTCFFDIRNFGSTLGSFNFFAGCYGASWERIGGRDRINFGPDFFNWFNDKFGLNLPFDNIRFTVDDSGSLTDLHLNLAGVGLNYWQHGRSLMMLISNLDFRTLGGIPFALKGNNPHSPGGDFEYATFEVHAKRWPTGQDYFDVPYQIKTCYAYTTYVSPMVCVDPNPYSDETKVCRAETYTWGGSQGGPVAVTRVEQINTGNEVVLDITIANRGRGRVWDVGYLESCSPYFPGSIRSDMLNTVYIGYARIGDQVLDCSKNHMVRLDPNTQQARLTCRYDLRTGEAGAIGSAYAVPLNMELWYGYEENYRGNLRVRNLG